MITEVTVLLGRAQSLIKATGSILRARAERLAETIEYEWVIYCNVQLTWARKKIEAKPHHGSPKSMLTRLSKSMPTALHTKPSMLIDTIENVIIRSAKILVFHPQSPLMAC